MTRYARLWRPAWYEQYLLDVREGRRVILALLASADELRGRFAATDSLILRRLAARIGSHLDTDDARQLLRLGAAESLRGLERFDQYARDTAKTLIPALIECLGAAEAMWSLAAATKEHGWSYPRPGSRLSVTGLFHPFLSHRAVRNDLQLGDEVRICFVTGPNMAGKSTFLKAVATATLLAHCGCGVPAAAMEFPVVGTLFSSVQMNDNLGAGESFYLAEVRRMRALAVALHDHESALAVIDEPFRGTNVHDAAEATLAVIVRLATHPQATVFVASHLAEVVPAISGDPRVRLLHFAADVTGDQPQFDYDLRPGMSTQRLGMTLLRQERVLELLERAAKPTEAAEETV
jgi:DNA mismatch repair ATPase MutS